jgi:hypothetical protein
MRTLRLSLAGVVILSLVGGLSVAVVAQDGADPLDPAYFTFTVGEPGEWDVGESTDIDDMTTEVRGATVVGIPVEASDPRASGLLASAHNADSFESDDSGVRTATVSVRLVNDSGAWSGTSTGVTVLAEDAPRSTELTVLAGEGGYEGLSLVMSASHDGDNEMLWGVIIPADGMPPIPDSVEVPVE